MITFQYILDFSIRNNGFGRTGTQFFGNVRLKPQKGTFTTEIGTRIHVYFNNIIFLMSKTGIRFFSCFNMT